MWLPLLVVVIVVLFFFIKNKIKLKRENKRLPPGPAQLPFIGNLHQLGTLPHRSLWKLSRKYGPIMCLKLGVLPTIVISSADAAKEVLKIHDLECCSRPALTGPGKLSYNFLDVGFSPYGEHWGEMRKLCVLKLFNTKTIQSFRFVREEEVGLLIDSLSQSSLSATSVDLSEMLLALPASIIFRIAFGKGFGGSGIDKAKLHRMVRKAQSVLGSFTASDFFPYIGWIVDRLTGLHAELERIFQELDDFFQLVIDEHVNGNIEKQEDVVDLLLRIEKDQPDHSGSVQLTRDAIKAIIMDIFLAGIDPSTITLIWAMTELARNPRVMKKAQVEIRSACFKKGKVTEADIDQLQYLKMIVKETLRLHSPAPLLLPREAISQFKLGDYDINPKTLVQVNVWAIGRDPDYWNSPEEFFPERFSDGSIDYKGQHFEFLPFGAGRRGCPGMFLGMAMVELALANLLCFFDWKLPDGMKETDIDMEEVSGITTYKKSSLKLVPMKYKGPPEDQN